MPPPKGSPDHGGSLVAEHGEQVTDRAGVAPGASSPRTRARRRRWPRRSSSARTGFQLAALPANPCSSTTTSSPRPARRRPVGGHLAEGDQVSVHQHAGAADTHPAHRPDRRAPSPGSGVASTMRTGGGDRNPRRRRCPLRRVGRPRDNDQRVTRHGPSHRLRHARRWHPLNRIHYGPFTAEYNQPDHGRACRSQATA